MSLMAYFLHSVIVYQVVIRGINTSSEGKTVRVSSVGTTR